MSRSTTDVISFELEKEDLKQMHKLAKSMEVSAGVNIAEPGAFTIRNHSFDTKGPSAFVIRNHSFSIDKPGAYTIRNFRFDQKK